jgi:N-acetylglucosamine kinase-like BadF-type ATPase
MLLVADSGSSKTDWILSISPGETLEFNTPGINPYLVGDKEITRIVAQAEEIRPYYDLVEEIQFFGAGASGPDKHEIVSNGLSALFRNAFISVESDLLGSAYATCGNQKGLIGVLGTGSNICFYNGREIIPGNHGLGFILGDEGSGSYFGKKLLSSYFNGQMSPVIHSAFRKQYSIDKEDVIRHVYKRPLPNSYIAAFARFMSGHKDDCWIKALLKEGFDEFLTSHVLPYADFHRYPTHFVGSIAWHFKDDLLAACERNKIKTGKILKNPIRDLFTYLISQQPA